MTNCILLIEDDEDDALLITDAFKAVGVSGAFRHVKDGEEAVNYFQGTGPYANRDLHPVPSLVLLDLQLPKMSGVDVLKWMRTQPNLKTVIVIILTGVPLDVEIQRAYLLGANSLLVKDATQEQLNKTIRVLKEYWLDRNQTAR